MNNPCNQPCPYNTLRGCTILEHPGKYCPMGNMAKKEYKRITNADRIRAMTDEQLATLLDCFSGCAVCRESEQLDDNPFLKDEKCDEDCEAHILEWLKQPAEDLEG